MLLCLDNWGGGALPGYPAFGLMVPVEAYWIATATKRREVVSSAVKKLFGPPVIPL